MHRYYFARLKFEHADVIAWDAYLLRSCRWSCCCSLLVGQQALHERHQERQPQRSKHSSLFTELSRPKQIDSNITATRFYRTATRYSTYSTYSTNITTLTRPLPPNSGNLELVTVDRQLLVIHQSSVTAPAITTKAVPDFGKPSLSVNLIVTASLTPYR
jgi:hypothetical protein